MSESKNDKEYRGGLSPEVMKTPKTYWATRRTEGYSDWGMAFWRELFQNSIDAGASKITIEMDDAPGVGVFGRPPATENVVRVVFSDNGSGMDENTLRNVFLRPGESTKKSDDSAIGGFGTARIVLCFSQVRYRIRTREWFVDGDGSEYTCMTRNQKIEATEDTLRRLQGADAQIVANFDIPGLERELAETKASAPYFDGCVVEVDINPEEFQQKWKNHNKRDLYLKLKKYVSMSQIPASVFFYQEQLTEKTNKNKARRTLSVTRDNEQIPFATIHVSNNENAPHLGYIIVRTNGVMMYYFSGAKDNQIIVEINPEMSRDVLTDSREDMKGDFRAAMDEFFLELASESRSALNNTTEKRLLSIPGGRGPLVGAGDISPDFSDNGKIIHEPLTFNNPETLSSEPKADDDYLSMISQVDAKYLEQFIDYIIKHKNNLLTQIMVELGAPETEKDFFEALHNGAGLKAFSLLPADVVKTLVTNLNSRIMAEENKIDEKMRDMHDVHIQLDGINKAPPALRNVYRRYLPQNWQRDGEYAGRGLRAHMLLSAWTACCESAVSTLLSLHPSLNKDKPLLFSTGFFFQAPKERWDSITSSYVEYMDGALHMKKDEKHLLLLNPINKEGKMNYDISSPHGKGGKSGLQEMAVLALHEAAHICYPTHNEDYANLLTQLAMYFNYGKTFDMVTKATKAVAMAYGKGEAVIQQMPDSPKMPDAQTQSQHNEQPQPIKRRPGRPRKPRPAEVLLAHAVPTTTIVTGALNSEENPHLPNEGVNQVIGSLIQEAPPTSSDVSSNITIIDCDGLKALEETLENLASVEWHPDALSQDKTPIVDYPLIPADVKIISTPTPPTPPAPPMQTTPIVAEEAQENSTKSQPENTVTDDTQLNELDLVELDKALDELSSLTFAKDDQATNDVAPDIVVVPEPPPNPGLPEVPEIPEVPEVPEVPEPMDMRLYDMLLDRVRFYAAREGVLPENLLSNGVVRQIALTRPTTPDALANIPGMKFRKFIKYSDGLLSVVRSYLGLETPTVIPTTRPSEPTEPTPTEPTETPKPDIEVEAVDIETLAASLEDALHTTLSAPVTDGASVADKADNITDKAVVNDSLSVPPTPPTAPTPPTPQPSPVAPSPSATSPQIAERLARLNEKLSAEELFDFDEPPAPQNNANNVVTSTHNDEESGNTKPPSP